ncbi:hypothetical protein ACK2SD_07160 [Pseudomonas sp. SC11]|uniref:hypothetical protein n=1 Tax=Pseudomonas sp. SC11 TaxID=326927 RepID=UPI0039996034
MSTPKKKHKPTAKETAQALYTKRSTKIIKKIRGVDREFFIKTCLTKISKIKKNNDVSFDFEHVWILAIKISATYSTGNRKPDNNEVVGIINSLWRLHNCLIPYLESNLNPMIAMRAMFNQQSTLQHHIVKSYADIMRQSHLLSACDPLNNYLKAKYGFSITTYCFIWFLILTQITNSEFGSTEINLGRLILDCHAYIKTREIYNFFKAFSISPREMPAFFANYTTYDPDFESYFYDSPLKRRPFIHTGMTIRTISNNLAFSSASFLLPQLFKDSKEISPTFKKIFTKKFEDYIGELLAQTNVTHKTEEQIKDLYRSLGHSGKTNNVVDHMLISPETKTVLLVESKGVEQTDFVKVILDSTTLAKRLEDNHIKGIAQSQQCIGILEKSPDFAGYTFYSCIIVNDDYGFSDAESLEKLIGASALAKAKTPVSYPSPIPFSRILFVRISTLEKVCSSIQDSEYTLGDLLHQLESPQTFGNLEKIHHSLSKAHPAEAIAKILTENSPAIQTLLSQKSGRSETYSLLKLMQNIHSISTSLTRHHNASTSDT